MKEYDNGKTIFANGIFDLLHPGHIELLKFAKSLGGKFMGGGKFLRPTTNFQKIKKRQKPQKKKKKKRKVLLKILVFFEGGEEGSKFTPPINFPPNDLANF